MPTDPPTPPPSEPPALPPTDQELEAIARERLPEALRDVRYPRTGWRRAGRWLLRWAWVGFVAYIGQAASQLAPQLINGQTVTGDQVAQAFLLGRVLPMLGQAPLLVLAAPASLLVLVILAGLWAHLDGRNQQRVLKAQDEWVAREVRRLHAAAVAQQHVEAAVGDLRAKGEGGAAAPLGPPFDDGLLPPPERLVGREAELAWLLDRLRRGGTTAITALRGLGGIGKSALAAVAIRQLHAEGRFPDGIAVVLAAGLSDPSTVLAQALTRFDPLRRPPEASDLAGLAETAQRLLAGKRTLIVLDNIEPGWPVEQVVAPLAAAGATLLLTARQALDKAVPAGGSKVLDLLSPEDALEVFAQAYGRDTTAGLNADERAAAERITRSLQYHTLAVKLAGGYAASTNRDLGALAGELERDPLAVWDGETPRGVALVLGRSVDALDADARRLFGALAAFATPEFGRQAALAVGEALGLADAEASLTVLTLRALVEGATNAALPEEADRERLRLHALLRAEAQTELKGWSEDARTQAERAVAMWYASYANAVPDPALTPDETNITTALEWAHAHDEQNVVMRLSDGMRQFWRDRSKNRERRAYLPWAIAAAEVLVTDTSPSEDRRLLARLYTAIGELLSIEGRTDEAENYMRRSLEIRRAVGDKHGEGVVLTALGRLALQRGNPEAAEDYYRQALKIDQDLNMLRSEGIDLADLGDILARRGDLAGAQANYERYLAVMRDIGDTLGEGIGLGRLGDILARRGDLAGAQANYERYLAVMRDVGATREEGVAQFKLGQVAEAQGRMDDAESSYDEGLSILRSLNDVAQVAAGSFVYGEFLITRRNRRDEGCSMLAEAARLYDEMGVPGGDEARATAQRLGCG